MEELVILSQNKTGAFMCHGIRRDENVIYALLGFDEDSVTFIGEYETAERACEIIEEMFDVMLKKPKDDFYSYYKMPKE